MDRKARKLSPTTQKESHSQLAPCIKEFNDSDWEVDWTDEAPSVTRKEICRRAWECRGCPLLSQCRDYSETLDSKTGVWAGKYYSWGIGIDPIEDETVSVYPGVHWYGGSWRVAPTKDGKRYWLGNYEDEDLAGAIVSYWRRKNGKV